MNKSQRKTAQRRRRHLRIRAKIFGTAERPRLSVFKSNKFVYAQLIDDTAGVTLAAVSTEKFPDQTALAGAREIGKKLADLALGKKIARVVFDRGGYIYTGKIRAVADGAREGGLKF